MTKVVYSLHLKLRLKLRNIPDSLPKTVYQNASETYFDRETNKYIAVKKVQYRQKIRDMAVVYDNTDGGIRIITIHPLKNSQKQNRIKAGRWSKI